MCEHRRPVRSRWVVLFAVGLASLQPACRSCARTSSNGGPDQGADLAAGDADPTASRRVRLAKLKRPPVPPPEDALALEHGGRWRLVRAGAGEAPTMGDSVRAEVSIWKADGTLVFSTYEGGGEAVFPLAMTPDALKPVFLTIRPGAMAQLWLPRELLADAERSGHRPRILPIDDVVLEYELLSFEKGAQGKIIQAGSPPSARGTSVLGRPDAAGPPSSAVHVGPGVKYVVLHPGSGTRVPSPDARVQMRMNLWHVRGLLIEGPVLDTVIATSPARSPAGLSKLIAGAQEGEVVRVWLSAARASEAFPSAGAYESVCDLEIESVTP